jgi:hypothetical protein
MPQTAECAAFSGGAFGGDENQETEENISDKIAVETEQNDRSGGSTAPYTAAATPTCALTRSSGVVGFATHASGSGGIVDGQATVVGNVGSIALCVLWRLLRAIHEVARAPYLVDRIAWEVCTHTVPFPEAGRDRSGQCYTVRARVGLNQQYTVAAAGCEYIPQQLKTILARARVLLI